MAILITDEGGNIVPQFLKSDGTAFEELKGADGAMNARVTLLPQEVYDMMDTQNALLASIASHTGDEGIKVTNWEDVQRVVRMGIADKLFSIGDQFVSPYNESSQIIWDVIGINHDIPTDKNFTHSLTLQAHNVITTAMVDNKEALYYAATELAAGTYHFTYDTKTYQFSLTQAVPVGGQITFPWLSDTDILTTKISTYESKTATTPIETNIGISEGVDGTELTPINDMNRCRYGSNNYKESAIKQWLNSSEASFIWLPKTDFDRPPTGSIYSGAGFLNLLDPNLVTVLGKVDKQVSRNTVNEGGGQDTFSDKVFLLSRVEVYGGTEGTTTGETAYAYYSTLAGSPTADALAGRIKYNSSKQASLWWLRSPGVGYSYSVRDVRPTGHVYGNLSAYYAHGLAPACCIV